MEKNSLGELNTLSGLQEQAFTCFIEGKYGEAAILYEKLVSLDDSCKNYYWYLGLSQLLQGQETEAQMTWLLAIENIEIDQLDQLTSQLSQVLEQEAQRQVTLGSDQVAINIRYHLHEIEPYNLANLVAIVLLSIKIKTFTSIDLVELGVIDLVDSGEFFLLEEKTLLDLLQELLTFNSPDKIIVDFVEIICLSHIQYKVEITNKLIHIVAYFIHDPNTAIQLLEMISRIDSQNLEVFIYLAEIYANNFNRLDKAIEIGRKFYSLAVNGRLIDRILSCHSLLKPLVFTCTHWEEAAKTNEELNRYLWSLVSEGSQDLSLREASFYLQILGFYTPYFMDCPQDAHLLRKELHQLSYDRIYTSEKNRIDNYKKLQAIRKKNYTPNRPLRIGYLSTCLRRHAVGSLVRWLLQYHDRERFELYAYFVGYKESDPLQVWFASQFHKSYKEVANSPIDLADQINQDGIDILIDLDSMTSGICSGVLNLKPAPIQVTWLGWDAAGQPTVDYFIADPYVLPESAQNYYTEKIWRLPHTYIAVDGFEVSVPTVSRNVLNIPSDAIVYFSAQAAVKRHPNTIRMQMKILKLVPNSYLILKSMGDQDALQDFFYKLAEVEGISIERLRFLPITNGEAEHRANLNIADIILDTYPYNGATHTIEALWMGIPIVTRVGEQFAARNSYTMMINAGITEGIAWTDEEYIDWGVRLGKDINLRQQVFWKLKQARQTAPLWNTKQFTQDMENSYEQMWVKYLESDLNPQDVDLENERELFVTEAETQNTQGINYAQQGKLDRAIVSFCNAISLNPNYADAYYNLGIAFSESGKLEQAAVNFQTTILLNSNHANALYNLGIILVKQGKINEAIFYYSKALELAPNDVETHIALGNAWFEQHKWEAAINSYQFALTIEPNSTSAHCGIGAVHLEQGYLKESISFFQSAIKIDPNNAVAYCNLGQAFSRSYQIKEAIHSYEKALEIKPDLGDAYWNFNVLINDKKYALSHNYKLGRQLADQFLDMCSDSDTVRALINFIINYVRSGLSDVATPRLVELENYIFNNTDLLTTSEIKCLYTHLLFILSSLRDTPDINSHLSRLIGSLYAEKVIKSQIELDSNEQSYDDTINRKPRDSSKLRIGFISRDFLRHPVGWCSFDVIRELTQITPHVYLYVTGESQPDDLTEMFEQLVEKFYHWKNDNNVVSDHEIGFDSHFSRIISDILQDRLDVLIDLDSLTVLANPHILYRQLAPVCISWLGFDAPFISPNNYYLCDWYTHPPTSDKNYVEKLIRLPDSHMAVSGFECTSIDRDKQREILGISSEEVVYLFAAAGRKFNRDTASACIQILKYVPSGVLLHKENGDIDIIRSIYEMECDQQGVNFKRVQFLPRYNTEEEHRSAYLLADVFLDAYPYNGGSHNLEALWFNLPLVTRVGEQSFARMGYSFLQSLGIDEGISRNREEYVDWGIRLGTDKYLRNSIKEKLIYSKKLDSLSPLWNPTKLATDMYNLLANLVAERSER